MSHCNIRGTWELEDNNQNEESLNSGTEGEWKLHKDEEVGDREFAMRQWNHDRDKTTLEGEWSLQEGKIWSGDTVTTTTSSSTAHLEPVHPGIRDKWREKYCCCDHLTEIKIFITIFGLINLGIMASGGVGFGLGLTNNHREETFKYLMVIQPKSL